VLTKKYGALRFAYKCALLDTVIYPSSKAINILPQKALRTLAHRPSHPVSVKRQYTVELQKKQLAPKQSTIVDQFGNCYWVYG
jgi:hypothetical protein